MFGVVSVYRVLYVVCLYKYSKYVIFSRSEKRVIRSKGIEWLQFIVRAVTFRGEILIVSSVSR